MKVLIFGSKGLVGSSLSKTLESNSKKFSVIPSSREDTDLFNFEETKAKILSEKPDVVVIAAAKVGGIYANNKLRTEFILENLKINMNILESCIGLENCKIINLGSSCIYPLSADKPISENQVMTGPLEPTNSPYAMAKLTAIEIGDSMSIQYGLDVINLMPTNLYGPNDNFSKDYSHVIPGLIARMHEAKENKAKEFNIWGTGKPLREFLFVDDLSRCIEFILENNITEKLINIGSGQEVTVMELAEKIRDIIGFSGELIFDKSMPDGNPRKLLDSSLINNLGWSPDVDLDSGLKITYDWYKNSIK